MSDNPFMAEAIAEARAGVRAGDGGPFGAVVVRRGEVIARGHNRVVADCDPTAHAEILAIRAAGAALGRFALADCELYSTCEPCPMCLAACLWARIPQLYYGATRDDAAAAGFDDCRFHTMLDTRRPDGIAITLLGREECLAVFREWSAKPDRVRY